MPHHRSLVSLTLAGSMYLRLGNAKGDSGWSSLNSREVEGGGHQYSNIQHVIQESDHVGWRDDSIIEEPDPEEEHHTLADHSPSSSRYQNFLS